MNASLKTAGWLGAALPMLAAMIDVTPAQAQSSARELPAVVVDQPARPPAARSRPAPRRQAASAASRRAAQRAQTLPDAAAAASARAETATGPVRGYLAGQSGTRTQTDTPLRETPQSITVVTADRVTELGRLRQESLRYVPGVFADAYGPDSRGDYPTHSRPGSQHLSRRHPRGEHVAVRTNGSPDPFTLERIEVLRHPGIGAVWRHLDGRPLEPGLEASAGRMFPNEIGVQYGSFNRKQVQLNSTGKLTKDGEWLYRFHRCIPRQRHANRLRSRRSHRAGTVADLAANQQHQLDRARHLPEGHVRLLDGIPAAWGTLFPGPNGLIPVRRFAGEPGFDKYQTETGTVSSLFEHSFGDGLKIRQNMRYAHVEGIYRTMYPDLTIDPANPDSPFLDSSRRTVARSIWSCETSKDSLTSDSNAELKVLTGPVAHKLLFGVDYRELRERARSAFASDPTPFDLYAPVYTGMTAPALTPEPDLRQTQLGLYVQDQMRLGPWLAIVGLRQDYVTSDVVGAPVENTKATTGRAGLMYELPFGLTPYVSYAQSFNPNFGSGVCFGVCVASRGEQVELGFKYNPFAGTAINGAVFDTTEKNRLATDPNSSPFSIQTGKVRIRGAELEVISRVTPDLDLIGAYSYLDARVESGDNAGKRVETVPEHQASLWAKYRLTAVGLQGVTIGGGVRYIGVSWDGADKLQTPDYTLFDAMVRYETGPWRFQVNASNIADKRHVTTCLARGDCFYGIGRTVLGSATYRF